MGLIKSSHPPFTFTDEQYYGLAAASLSATIISLLAIFAGLVVHFLLLWYDHHRPNNENYSTAFESKTTTDTSSIVIKDTTSGTDKYNLKAIQHNRKTNHVEGSPNMRSRHGRHGLFKKGSSTGAMNRVSLRLIVLACISYSIYSVTQIVVIVITEKVLACRILAYFNVCFDVMGSFCLGLVGLNLVLVFVVNVKHPERFEKYYYATAILVAILVLIPPLVLKAGRTIDKNDSCWYHFFFEGRKANPFNWLYYYSWLLFASILATASSIIAIRKLLLEKNNFAHTLNMLNREEASYPRPAMYPVTSSASTHFHRNMNHATAIPQQPQQTGSKKNTDNSSDLFRRVAIRCICYALVPVLCKSWGIGIEIAIISGIVVNYPILVIDRFMSCIMGFFVSCIYFSDPSVQMVWQDMMIDYKKRYVDQLYYVDITKVIRLERKPTNYYPPSDTRRQHHQGPQESIAIEKMHMKDKKAATISTHHQRSIYAIMNFHPSTAKKREKSNSIPEPVYIYDSALRRPMKYHPPSNIFNCHGYFTKEITTEKQGPSIYNWFKCFLCSFQCAKEKNNRWVPMRRIDIPLCRPQNRPIIDDTHSSGSQQSFTSSRTSEPRSYKKGKNRFFEPYSHPKLAKCIYWFFVNLLFYRPPYYHQQKRSFEKRKEKGKEKSQQPQRDVSDNNFRIDSSSEDSFSCTSMGKAIDENRTTAEADEQGGHSGGIEDSTVLPAKEESVILSSSPSPSTASSSLSTQRSQPAEVQQQPHPPPLRPGSRNRTVSSSLIKGDHEKAKESGIQGEVLGRRSSSYPLSSVANAPAAASSCHQLPMPSPISLSKQNGQYTKDTAADRAFLDQKLSLRKPHEGPSYRHIPTIGQLKQSVSPVQSFVSVRRTAAHPFAQAPVTRPSSVISGSSSLQSSPIAGSLVSTSSSSSSSSSSSPLKHGTQGRIISGQHKQQPFLIEAGGLSPPSKQHYAFIYRQGERISSSKKCPPDLETSSSLQVSSIIDRGYKNEQSHSSTSTIGSLKRRNNDQLQPNMSSLHTINYNFQSCTDADKEILFSGVRTILLHIKNDMDTKDRTGIDNHQQKAKNRIDILVGNWGADSTIHHS